MLTEQETFITLARLSRRPFLYGDLSRILLAPDAKQRVLNGYVPFFAVTSSRRSQ